MIEKLNLEEVDNPGEATLKAFSILNQLVDAVNLLQCKNVHIESDLQDLMYPKEIKGELAENVQPYYVTTSYPTDGHTKEYYGQNGASIVTDHPLPAGYIITIREPETKGE